MAQHVGDVVQPAAVLGEVGRAGVPQVMEAELLDVGVGQRLEPRVLKVEWPVWVGGTTEQKIVRRGGAAEAADFIQHWFRQWQYARVAVRAVGEVRGAGRHVDVAVAQVHGRRSWPCRRP